MSDLTLSEKKEKLTRVRASGPAAPPLAELSGSRGASPAADVVGEVCAGSSAVPQGIFYLSGVQTVLICVSEMIVLDRTGKEVNSKFMYASVCVHRHAARASCKKPVVRTQQVPRRDLRT